MTKKTKSTKKSLPVSGAEAYKRLSSDEIKLINEYYERRESVETSLRLKHDGNENYAIKTKTGNKSTDSTWFCAKIAKQYGVHDDVLAIELMRQLMGVARNTGRKEDNVNAAIALVAQIKPQDPIEAMLANQMVSIHLLAMESASRVFLENQTFDGVALHTREVNKLTRTFTAQMDALNKHRGKGQQKMTVEHIHVNEGGQAVIGNIDKKATS